MAQPGFAPTQSSSIAETIAISSLTATTVTTPLSASATTATTSTTSTTAPKHHKKNETSVKSGIAVGSPTLTKTETVFCGSTAGVVSRFVIAPLDVIKIRLQLQTQRKELPKVLRKGRVAGTRESLVEVANARASPPRYKGMFSGMATIAREEGIRGLWKGNMAAEYLYLTYGGIQFLAYQQTKLLLSKSAKFSSAQQTRFAQKYKNGIPLYIQVITTVTQSSSIQSFISGATAGIMTTTCTYPFDLLRTRFAAQRDVKVYTSVPQAFQHIFRQEGIKGFYRGMSAALIQVIPYMGVMFGSYDTLKQLAAWLKERAASSHNSETSFGSSSDPPLAKKTVGQIILGLEDMVCGGLSGVISKTAVYPLDMVRKRLQIQGSDLQRSIMRSSSSSVSAVPTTVWGCMTQIVQQEGYLALYKGLLPGILKAAPASAVTFLVFTQASAFIERNRQYEHQALRIEQ
ncbi:mitochondrial thiamine pyrophosphate transporter [Linnemannia zychae]|nr:mitochondrial thiamine pyrophosphate transporter [Linnemannia zychae]